MDTAEDSPALPGPIAQLRSISVFVVYMLINILLLFRCFSIISAQYEPEKTVVSRPRRKIAIFTALAIFSLVMTWYHMISFLIRSYRDWEIEHPDLTVAGLSRLGYWLNDTYLFQQAWAAVIETAPRFWWTIQIFGFASIWSVFLGVEGLRHRIGSLWIFMLLGQLVAISVAANLSFVAVLATRRPSKTSNNSKDVAKGGLALNIIIVISSVCAGLTRQVHGDKRFMAVLLIPHIAAFLPMTPWFKPNNSAYHTVIFCTTVMFAHATWRTMADGWTFSDILTTLHEYPAMSSAGWDVICCWISFTTWLLVN